MTIEGTARWLGVYEGTVIEVDAQHRVRANIPGVCKESAWARPRTLAGGPSRGGHMAPQKGDPVLVQFIGGDVKNPIYEGGPWTAPDGLSKTPTDIAAAGTNGGEVASLEFNRGGFAVRFTVDERDGNRTFRVQAVAKPANGQGAETVLGSIELDVEKRVIDVYGLAGVQLRSLGFIRARALVVQIQGRRVRRTSGPI